MGTCCGCGADDQRKECNMTAEFTTDLWGYKLMEHPVENSSGDNGTNGPELKKESPYAA